MLRVVPLSRCLEYLLVAWMCGGGAVPSPAAGPPVRPAPARVEPAGWFAGDPHVHRGMLCARENSTSMLTPNELLQMMEVNDLAVISVLGDIGNGEIRNAKDDLKLITGRDNEASKAGRILHWDAEWHFDPMGVTFEQKAMGGHLMVLGLKSGRRIYRECTYPIMEWARGQGAVVGFAHMQYLKDDIPSKLDCCAPLEYPVEVALTPGIFVMEDVRGSETAMKAYYRLLNSGFRPGLAAGTDYPCYAGSAVPLGDLLTYVQVPDAKLTYRKWIDGIVAGRTVVSRDGHNEFLDLKVNRDAGPGSEIKLKNPQKINVAVAWNSHEAASGTIEIVQNGVVVASTASSAQAGVPALFDAQIEFQRSGWICARRMGTDGHHSHTAAVFVMVGNQPIRTSAGDARFFVRFIDNLLEKTAAEGEWGKYLTSDREAAHARYKAARAIYERIADEARRQEK